MKTLVATKEGQGKRKNDFSHTQEGEFVRFGFECDGGTVDDNCGCKRSMSGFETLKATTTIKIVEKDITVEDYTEKLKESIKKAGFYMPDMPDIDKDIKEEAKELLSFANTFNVGRILERRGAKLRVREV